MKNIRISDIEDSKPLVSIICDVYNQEKFIRQCLDGFLMQHTNFPFDILIHDDASTDSSQHIITEYINKYPKLIKPILQQKNQYSQGISIWRDIQFPRVRSKYVALCEGDDYWTDSNKLQIQVDFLENHPEYTMCFHNVTEHFENGTIPDRLHWNIDNRDYSDLEIFGNWIIQTASVVMRSDVLTTEVFKKMFYEVRPVHGDIPLFVVCSMCGKIKGMKKVMSVYRRHDNNISSITNLTNPSILIQEANYYLRFYNVFGYKYKKKCINAYIRDYTSAFIYTRKQGRTNWSCLIRAFRKAPIQTIYCLFSSIKASIRRRVFI